MNKTLDKNLQMYISKMAIESMPFGREWNSSAKDLEKELQKRKIKIPYQLYYEYKLPNGYKPDDFMQHLIKEYFVNNFYSYFAGKILKDKELKISDKAKIFKYIWNSRGKYKNLIKQYESLIREQNPELSDTNVIKVYDSRSLVYGALFGFAPQEIKYYADGAHRDFAKEKEIFTAFKNYGINVSYVLAPETAEMILAALKQNTQNKSKER
jgi:hypothetical protein